MNTAWMWAVEASRRQVESAFSLRSLRGSLSSFIRASAEAPPEVTIRVEVPSEALEATGEVPRRDPMDFVRRLIV